MCKTGLKIKSPAVVGTTIKCPKCKKRIEVVTPEEDGYIPYTVGPVQAEKNQARSDQELADYAAAQEQLRREKRKALIKHIISILILLGALSFIAWIFIDWVIPAYQTPPELEKQKFKDKKARIVLRLDAQGGSNVT